MATEVISKIGSDPNDDYSTLQAWYSARGGNLVERDTIEIAELRGETHEGLFMNGYFDVVDSGHYFEIRAMEGAEFRGDFGNLSGKAVIQGQVFSGVPYTKIKNVFIGNFPCDFLYAIEFCPSDCIYIGNVGVGVLTGSYSYGGICLHNPQNAMLENLVISDVGPSGVGVLTYCNENCQMYCQSSCQSSCQDACENSCQEACQVSCQETCQVSCQETCQLSCQEACQVSCQESCELSCQYGCEVSCEGWNQ